MSPIEDKLQLAICEQAASNRVWLACHTTSARAVQAQPHQWRVVSDGDFEEWGVSLDDPDFEGAQWSLYRQVSVLTYKADLVLSTFWGAHVLIECDGHDWHDRTKQQAAYDRSRDRELLLAGLATVRFTGSEIHHSAERCASEVWALARQLDGIEAELTFVRIDAHELHHLHRQGKCRRLDIVAGCGEGLVL